MNCGSAIDAGTAFPFVELPPGAIQELDTGLQLYCLTQSSAFVSPDAGLNWGASK
jgi:hypothetical protein